MDSSQADAIAEAVLEPDLKAQQEIRRKRTQQAAKLAAHRRHGGFVLVGYIVGAVVGYFVLGRIGFFGLMGAAAGILGSVLAGRLRKRGAA